MNEQKRPTITKRPGITYKFETFSFFKKRTIYTYQILENNKWIEYDKETDKPTGKIFEN